MRLLAGYEISYSPGPGFLLGVMEMSCPILEIERLGASAPNWWGLFHLYPGHGSSAPGGSILDLNEKLLPERQVSLLIEYEAGPGLLFGG